jgi:SHS2 domain-containing protein
MGHFETFDHTADLGLRIRGQDLTELFRTAATGLFDVIVANPEAIGAVQTETVSLEAELTEDLLVAWLNDLIFRFETRHQLYTRFDIVVDESKCRLDGTILGEAIDRGRHLLDHEVKAATRHGLCLRPEAGGWIAEVILDI